ncbi:MAG: Glutathione-binding protein GsiB precursor [Pseudomonadota bacterium]|jgi:peptide/nickel transport system substrate-binding protein
MQIPFLRRLATAAFAAGLVAVAAPGTAVAQQPPPKKGGTLVYAYQSGPGTLDPYVSSSAVELEVIHHLFEGLVAINEKYETKPMVATSFEISHDARTFTFRIRKGLKFHDGSPLSSADVAASFERYVKVSPNASVFADVANYSAPDPETFVIRLGKPNAVFVDILKSPVFPFVILPASQKEKPPRGIDVIGSGPFKLGEWVKDSHLVIERFDGYQPNTAYSGPDGFAGRRLVHLDAVRYRFIPENNARVAALQTGAADVVASIPPDLAKRFAANASLEVMNIFPFCMQVYIVNSSQGPTRNPKVRQAINAVVDADEIQAAMGQLSRSNHSLVYSFSPFYQGDAMRRYYSQKDPKKARALLQEAGYKGEEIVLQTNSNYPSFRDAILVLSELMKAAGMNVKVDVVDWTTNASNMQRGTGTWNVSTTGFCSNPLLGPQQWRTMFYTFPQVKDDKVLDSAFDKFYTSLDFKQRREAWEVIEKQVLEQSYMIKIADMGTVRAFNRAKVQGFDQYYLPRFWGVSLK